MRRDPETAIAWAASIAEPQLRFTQLEQLAKRWMQADASAARQWLAQTDMLAESAKHRVLDQRPVARQLLLRQPVFHVRMMNTLTFC